MIAALAFFCFIPLALADQVTPSERVTTQLRVRADAASDAEVVGYLKPGEKAELVKTMGAWRKIKLTDTTGYVSTSYTTVSPDAKPGPAPSITDLPKPEGASLLGNQNVLLGLPLDADASDESCAA